MSNIDKEWLQKKIAEMEAARDEIPFGLDEDDSNTLAALRIALASLEAEPAIHRWRRVTSEPYGPYPWHYGDFIGFSKPVDGIEDEYFYSAPPAPANAEPAAWLWSHRKHPSEVTLVRPEDDEKAEGAHWSGWSCQALYAAPPAPVSVPDEWKQWIADAVEYLEGGLEADGELEAEGSIEAKRLLSRRAAMLQGADGNSPVIPDGWVACSERMPDGMQTVITSNGFDIGQGWWDGEGWNSFDSHDVVPGEVTHWMPLPAAPQQEVKP
ncbi:TPA: DUF551 domain-containing protein [Enterobacter kobei]|uniref:DUF551 domain-containing protein n=1 Tax=Enterobacter kobei TaxID=208224 RepID=UPI002B0D9471|nr:DUF551 domain-containing protein [Enterobacter kobei]MCM8082458.1 DUF551 domain-containing protein [Enterobacter hormaechei]MEB7528766.1 DUF551 domain-containing protein [Enterobacter kobei]HEP0499255.1 DUF551 domain-containing protein [Enterobacter kobei]